eukprot:210037_1
MTSLLMDDEVVRPPQPQSTLLDTSNANNGEFPITKQLSCKIKNESFEFVIQNFTDKIFIIITEKGRIGQIVSASSIRNNINNKIHFSMNTILGVVDDFSIINLLARQLIQQISKTSNKTLLLGVGFRRNIPNDFLPLILKCIEQIRDW